MPEGKTVKRNRDIKEIGKVRKEGRELGGSTLIEAKKTGSYK